MNHPGLPGNQGGTVWQKWLAMLYSEGKKVAQRGAATRTSQRSQTVAGQSSLC